MFPSLPVGSRIVCWEWVLDTNSESDYGRSHLIIYAYEYAGHGRLKSIGNNTMNSLIPKRRRRMALEPAPIALSCGSLIPDDILFFNILILLPVKCLVRFQTVSKS